MCSICGVRPQTKGEHRCKVCQSHIEAEERTKRERQDWWKGAYRYAVWRGLGIGLFPKANGRYEPRALPLSALAKTVDYKGVDHGYRNLPFSRLIDLDRYCRGYDRRQVQKLKAAILRCNFVG